MIHVGKPLPASQIKSKNLCRYTYRDVIYDDKGWADTTKYLPLDYDLILAKDDRGHVYSGWYNGFSWDGKNLTEDHNILFWKRGDHDTHANSE